MRAKRVHSNTRPVFTSQLEQGIAAQRQGTSCGLILIVLLLVAALGYGVWRATISASDTSSALHDSAKAGTQFLTAVQQKDYTTAETLLTASGQYTLSPDSLDKTFSLVSKQSGIWLTSSLSNQELRTVGDLQMCNCDYSLGFDHGTVQVRLVMVRGFRGWKVNTMTMQ